VLNPANGCKSKDSTYVTQDTSKVKGATASAGKITCSATNATIYGNSTTSGATYRWEGSGGFTYNGNTTEVSVPGDYKLYITNPATGCDTLFYVNVPLDTIRPRVTIAASGILSCSANSVNLMASSTTSGLSYAWAGPNFTATSQNTNVTEAGDYYVTATNPTNNCLSTTKYTVIRDVTPPTVGVSVVGTLTCASPTVKLLVTSGADSAAYNWSGPLGYISNEASPVVNASGSYLVTVTNKYNNCSNSKQVDVASPDTTKPAPVLITIGGVINCRDHTVALYGYSTTTNVTYAWEGPNGFTSQVQNTTAQNPGTYVLTATSSSNGCKSQSSATVVKDDTPPSGISATASGTINCTDNFVELAGAPSVSNYTYLWSGPSVINETEMVAYAFAPGVYKLIVTNSLNYCKDSTSVTVLEDFALPTAHIIAPSSSPVALANNTISAQAVSGATYAWVVNASNQYWYMVSGADSQTATFHAGDASTSGTFTLTVTGANGCPNSDDLTLTAVSSLKNVQMIAGNGDEVQKNFSFTVYPNPFTDKAVLKFTPAEDSHITVELHSGIGKLEGILFDSDVQSSQSYKITIERGKMQAGTYYIIIRTNGAVYSQKLMLLN
jgi:hypothetical protein